eukprot:Rmarinus@m.12981
MEIKQFTDNVMDMSVFFHIVVLMDSFFVWIGTAPSKLKHVSVALPSPNNMPPSSSTLIGNPAEDIGDAMARRLVQRTKKVFYIAFNIPNSSGVQQQWAEKRLISYLSNEKLI